MVYKVTRGKENLFYSIFTILFVLLMLFFISSKSFMYDDEPVMQTPFHTSIKGLDQTSVTLESWKYNPQKSLMEVIIQMKHTGTDAILPTFAFQAKEKKSLQNLPVEVVFHDEEMYVFHIKDVPSKYSVVGLYIKENRNKKLLEGLASSANISMENGGDTSTNIQVEPKKIVLTGDYRKVKMDKNLSKKNSFQYIEETIQSEINGIQKNITMIYQKEIPLQNQIIKSVEKENIQIEKDKKYQTKEEQINSNSKLNDNENQIKEAKKTQNEWVKEIETLKEKINKLEQKKADVESQYRTSN